MADVSKFKNLKSRSTLGAPPPMEEASNNLSAPETAPSAPASAPAPEVPVEKIDFRSARRTNRTVQFATRVKPEWDAEIRAIALREDKPLVEILEWALAALRKELANR